MPKAYRVKRYDHVTPAKRRRLLEEKLVPLLDESSNSTVDIQSFLSKGDWLIEYVDYDNPLYLYKVKTYQFKPRLHLYIDHFAEVEHLYRLEGSALSDSTHILLTRTDHLEQLPAQICDIFRAYHEKATNDPIEKVKQLIFTLELGQNIDSKTGQELLRQLETGEVTAERLKAKLNKEYGKNKAVKNTKIRPGRTPAQLVDPNKITGAIPKAALETYIKNNDGQLPTVKEFDKLVARFMNPRSRRRRNTRY